mgnify:FL=1
MNKKYKINLSSEEIKKLEEIISKGSDKSRKITRARILLLSDEKNPEKHKDIAKFLKITDESVTRICKRYVEEGLEIALSEKPRSGKPKEITGEEEAKIIALSCSKSPDGYQRWTLRLLADKAVELSLVEHISHNEVGNILKKTNLNRTLKSNGA